MNKTLLAILLGMLTVPSLPATGFPGDIAIVVSRENPTDALSFKDLVKIFKLERQHWEGGKKIYLIMQEAGAPEREVILKKIYRMDDQELKRLLLAKLYTEEISAFPKTLGSSEAVKRFVSQVPMRSDLSMPRSWMSA